MVKQFHNISFWSKKNPIYTIIIVSLFLRLIIMSLYQHVTVYPDTEDYINLAQRLLYFNLNGYEGQRSPGYPLLLGLTHINLYLSVIFQSILGIIANIYMYKLCLTLSLKVRSSLLLTLFIVSYIPSIFFEYAILTESLTLFFITMIFYTLFRLLKQNNSNPKYYISLSVLCTFLVLIKPFYVYLPCLLFIISIIYNNKKQIPISKTIFILIFPLLAFIGWSGVNKSNTGYFTSTTYYGFNIAQNCVSFAEYTTNEYKDIGDIYAKYRDNRDSSKYEIAMTIWEAYPELKEKTDLSFPDLSNRLYNYSITTIKRNPTDYLKQVAISWTDFWKTSLYWEYDSFAIPYSNFILKYICYAERIVLQSLKILFVLLIPFHAINFVRRKYVSPQFIISIVVFVTSILQAIITYGTNSRFSFPFEMFMVLSVALDYFDFRKLIKLKS